jgi:hypothetical protein
MERTPEQLEALWNNLLSRQPELVREAFNSLDSSSQEIVLIHLKNMAEESGWQPEQVISAKAALLALEGNIDQEK